MNAPLAGLRILDFCWIGAGALVTKALAELGAEVIRVESRSHPDNLRLTPPFRPGTEGLEASGYFASRNPNKKSFALNMSHPEAREIARQLVGQVDAVTSNFRPGVMVKWGLSYEDVRSINPDIVYLVMPMQGSDGPHSSFIGFGSTIAALGGLVNLTGEPGRIPVGTGTHFPDHVPNPGHSLVALLAALYRKRTTGQGQRVELSQLESTLNTIGSAFLAAGVGQPLEAQGNDLPNIVPRGVYRTADDKWLVVVCPQESHWIALATLIGGSNTDPLVTMSLTERRTQRLRINAAVSEWAGQRNREDLIRDLDNAGVPNGPVHTSADMTTDPSLETRGFWDVVDHPVIGEMPMFRLPFLRDGDGRDPMSRPPLLGEHTWEIASTLLGMDETTFETLTVAEILY